MMSSADHYALSLLVSAMSRVPPKHPSDDQFAQQAQLEERKQKTHERVAKEAQSVQ